MGNRATDGPLTLPRRLPNIASMYIDPGLGALLLQGFVAGILGATFAARQKIRRLFRKLMGKAAE
jgi:hypothetical protein